MGLDADVRRLSDELEIRNLAARLAHLADGGDLEEYLSLYTEDAVWDAGSESGRRQGHAEILAGARERRAAGLVGPGANSRHILTTLEVHVDGERARSRSNFMFFAGTDANPQLQAIGLYQDEYRRTPQGWKLARRTIVRG